MKKIALLVLTLATVALFAKPVFAEHEHNHEKDMQEAQGEVAEPVKKMCDHESMMHEPMGKMRAQMEKINKVKKPKERQKLLQEHNKSMRDSIKMMREMEMMGGMAMGDAMGSGRMMGGNKTGGHCDHKKGGHMMGGGMAGSHKMCDHKMGNPSASQPDDNADAAPVAQSNLDQIAATDKTPTNPAKKLWTCPMHPDVTQDHPGVCPKCGMDLVEMEQPGASQPEHSHTMGGGMKCDKMKDDCMSGGDTKCAHKMGDSMKGGCMEGGGMKCRMMGMMEKRMDMMLMLMEQMIEHNEAEMTAPK